MTPPLHLPDPDSLAVRVSTILHDPLGNIDDRVTSAVETIRQHFSALAAQSTKLAAAGTPDDGSLAIADAVAVLVNVVWADQANTSDATLEAAYRLLAVTGSLTDDFRKLAAARTLRCPQAPPAGCPEAQMTITGIARALASDPPVGVEPQHLYDQLIGLVIGAAERPSQRPLIDLQASLVVLAEQYAADPARHAALTAAVADAAVAQLWWKEAGGPVILNIRPLGAVSSTTAEAHRSHIHVTALDPNEGEPSRVETKMAGESVPPGSLLPGDIVRVIQSMPVSGGDPRTGVYAGQRELSDPTFGKVQGSGPNADRIRVAINAAKSWLPPPAAGPLAL